MDWQLPDIGSFTDIGELPDKGIIFYPAALARRSTYWETPSF